MSSLISFFCLFVCFKTLSYYNTHFPWSHILKSITFFISDLWKTLNKTNKPTFLFFHTFHFGIYQSLILDYVFLSVLARENFFSKSDKELFAALLQSQPQTNKKPLPLDPLLPSWEHISQILLVELKVKLQSSRH